jgi:zinc protease
MTLLFAAPPRRDPRRFSAAMIAGVASGQGGRFFDELREKRSLCYTVHASVIEREMAGAFSAYIATSPAQEDAARDALLAEIARFRDEPVTSEELVRSQTYAIGVHAIRQQSGAAVLADVIDAWLFGDLRDLELFDERVRAVTAESMQAVAREYLVEGRRAEGIVRGKSESRTVGP